MISGLIGNRGGSSIIVSADSKLQKRKRKSSRSAPVEAREQKREYRFSDGVFLTLNP